MSKFSELREKMLGAFSDVPDTLVGTIVSLVVLTAIGLGLLLLFGFRVTQ